MAIADYLRKLVELKNQLVANLNSMGVTADESEKLNTLVPKIMDIETGVDTSDATATAADILKGKTAYVNDVKVSGTLVQNVELDEKSQIISINIPSGTTSIGNYAFNYLATLESITIPDSVTTIGYYAFRDCYKLQSIIIPNGVTSIGESTFYNNYKLASVTIPDSLISIGNMAFKTCQNLANIYYMGTQKQWSAITKGYDWSSGMGSKVEGGTVIHYNYVPE